MRRVSSRCTLRCALTVRIDETVDLSPPSLPCLAPRRLCSEDSEPRRLRPVGLPSFCDTLCMESPRSPPMGDRRDGMPRVLGVGLEKRVWPCSYC